MAFLNPLLLIGLAGVAVPVLVHLLNLYRFHETDWAAMRFLQRAAQVRSRQIRLRDILLMLLRCLAVALLVLALARPVFRPTGPAAMLGESRAGVVIAVDGSYSMMHQVAGRSRFERAIERAQQIAGTIHSGDPVSLVLVGTRHRVLLRNMPFDADAFAAALRDLSPLAERADLETLPETIEPLLQQTKAAQQEVYLISDVQRRDWQALSPESQAGYQRLAGLARVAVVPVEPGNDQNLAIADFQLASGMLRRDSMARYTARVENFGTQLQKNVRVICRVNDNPVDERTIDSLAPGAAASVSLFAPLTEVGRVKLRAEIQGDELAIDNSRFAVAHVRERLRVLCVDGSPSPQRFEGATDFLVSALSLPRNGETGAPLEIDALPWSALATVSFQQYDVVMLADLAELPEQLAPSLSEFVRAGGGLVVFVGPNTRPEIWNRRLLEGSVKLLPARLEGLAEEPFGETDGWPLDTALSDHPLCQPLAGLPGDLLGHVRFWRYMKLAPVAESHTVLRIAPGADPLLVEHRVGRGRVLLFASTANRLWHNMVINPAFPMLLNQMVTYLTQQDLEVPVPAGSPIVVALDDMEVGADVTFVEPTGRTTHTQTVERQGRTVGVLEQTEQVGFHLVQCVVASPAFVVAVNPQTGESDVRTLERDELERVAKELGMRVMWPQASLAPAIAEARLGRELWLPLMIGAVAAILAEALLAHALSRRRSTPTEAVG
ncbi:MAG: BatA domain-containing protein [Phycisphaeraceae bacterium]